MPNGLGDEDSRKPLAVIPSVPFIRRAMAVPLQTTGSLWPTFVPVRPVSLTVRQAYAITLQLLTIQYEPTFAHLVTF